MGSWGSYSALGSVALGPPDKMGSALGVLARVGHKGQGVQSWGDGSGDGSGARLLLEPASPEPRGG